MNDEIKEILDKVCSFTYYGWITRREGEQIRDYITNLQQSLKDMTDINLENEKELTNLQQEIEKLNEDKRGMLVQLYKANDRLEKQRKEYQDIYKDVRIKIKEKNDTITNLQQELNEYKFPNCKTKDIEVVRANLVDMMRKNKRLEQENERLKEKTNQVIEVINNENI